MQFIISNTAGGDERTFRLRPDGSWPDTAIRHARRIGDHWLRIGGEAADAARAWYDAHEEN